MLYITQHNDDHKTKSGFTIDHYLCNLQLPPTSTSTSTPTFADKEPRVLRPASQIKNLNKWIKSHGTITAKLPPIHNPILFFLSLYGLSAVTAAGCHPHTLLLIAYLSLPLLGDTLTRLAHSDAFVKQNNNKTDYN